MSDIISELDKDNAAHRRLEDIAKGKPVTLTADQAKRILSHMKWLSDEREACSSCNDDD